MNICHKPHLYLAHHYWRQFLHPHDSVIDATCGNGKDTQVLASLVPQGKVYSMDIQIQALEQAKKTVLFPNVIFLLQSHAELSFLKKVKLVVYNLGYLPKGNKAVTTLAETTLASFEKALQIAQAISVVCYPGHPEGAKEEEALLKRVQKLDSTLWKASLHQWSPPSPSLLWIVQNQPLTQ